MEFLKDSLRKGVPDGDSLQLDEAAVLDEEVGRLVLVVVAVGSEGRNVAGVDAGGLELVPCIIGLEKTGGVVTAPVSPEICVELGVVPSLAYHSVEEESQVETFPGSGEVETSDECRLVRTENDPVLGIDDVVTVCVGIPDSSDARSAILHIILAQIFIDLLLGAEYAVSLESEP